MDKLGHRPAIAAGNPFLDVDSESAGSSQSADIGSPPAQEGFNPFLKNNGAGNPFLDITSDSVSDGSAATPGSSIADSAGYPASRPRLGDRTETALAARKSIRALVDGKAADGAAPMEKLWGAAAEFCTGGIAPDRRSTIPLGQRERETCEQAGLAPDQAVSVALAYRQARIPLNPQTLAVHYVDANRLAEMQPLDAGMFNTVYLSRYRDPEHAGGAVERVFKPEGRKGGMVSRLTGIAANDLRSSCRNVAASNLNRKLGWEVIPDTAMALHAGQAGIVMERATGIRVKIEVLQKDVDITRSAVGAKALKLHQAGTFTPGVQTNLCKQFGISMIRFENDRVIVDYGVSSAPALALLKDGKVRRELAKLQLLDALMAQGDRHEGNYFIDPDTGAVKGIDNDQSFGKLIRSMVQMTTALGGYGTYWAGLPEIVDAEIRADFLRLSEDDARAAVEGLLDPEETEATLSRLREIQVYLTALPPERVIDPDRWAQIDFPHSSHSYVARHSDPFTPMSEAGNPA